MLRNCLMLVGAIAVAELPNSASADVCQGLFAWLCSQSSEAAPDDGLRRADPANDSALDRPFAGRPPPSASRRAAAGSPCLSRDEVHGGHARYRVVDGRHCWHASTNSQERKHRESDPRAHGDPASGGRETARVEPTSCELQALKLDAGEKKIFMKQCME